MNAAREHPGLTRELVQRIRTRPVGADDLGHAERYVRDLLGSTAAGLATVPGRALLAHARSSTDLESTAFTVAALSHIAEADDLHRSSVTHPGCVVVPVALLLGYELGAEGPEVLHAVLAGYDAMLRVGEALGPGHYRIFHNTGTAGVFGSAAAAATLLDLDEDAWVWAMGNAGTQASGLWQFNHDAAMSKHLHAGHAAQAGLRAALLAREGFTGAEAILEGERGFFAGFCPDPDPGRVLAPCDGWKAPETSLKPYPSCRHTHPAIDAALEIKTALGPDPASALANVTVTIGTYPAALRLTDEPSPRSPYGAKFSLQFCVATALLHGPPSLDSFTPDRLSNPTTRSLMARTQTVIEEDLASAYPMAWGATVAVQSRGTLRHHVTRTGPKGDPERPLTDDEIDRKVRRLGSAGGLEPETVEHLLESSKTLVSGGSAFLPPGLPFS